jgi:hypothetical protein
MIGEQLLTNKCVGLVSPSIVACVTRATIRFAIVARSGSKRRSYGIVAPSSAKLKFRRKWSIEWQFEHTSARSLKRVFVCPS